MPNHRSVVVDGATLRVSCDGDSDRPMLALVNPAGVNSGAWEPVLPRLTPHFRVIRHDYRGTGHSLAGVGDDQFSFDRYADDLARVLDELQAEQVVVWGCAFGSRVGLNFASRHPDRVRLLALYDASVTVPDPPASALGIERAAELRRAAGLPNLVRAPAWSWHADPDLAMHVFRSGIRNPHMAYLLPGIVAPTLIATGDCDPNLASSRDIAKALPDAELTVLALTGHISILERPELCVDVFEGFVRGRGLV